MIVRADNEAKVSSGRGCTQEFPTNKLKKLLLGPCGRQKQRPVKPPSFAAFVNQPFVLNRPLEYYYGKSVQ